MVRAFLRERESEKDVKVKWERERERERKRERENEGSREEEGKRKRSDSYSKLVTQGSRFDCIVLSTVFVSFSALSKLLMQ